MVFNKSLINGLGVYCLLMVVFLTLIPFQQSRAVDTLGPDDVLRITVYGYDDLKTDTRVSADGKITFPLIGEVIVSGKSSIALEEEIAGTLISGGFIHDAQVNVKVLERLSQQVSVLGFVNKPGRYALESDSSIVDLIAMAGGINENGNTSVAVTRSVDGKLQKQTLDLRQYMDNAGDNVLPFKMKQNDVVYVPKATTFYIYGEVQKPGVYRLEPGTSVVKALSVAGGLTLRGTENGIVIKRKNAAGELQEIDAELNAPLLQDDVVYVDERWF
jgi:polysaccharide biosynthesis/export protein